MLTSSIWSLISRHVRNFRCGTLSLRKIHSRQNCYCSFCWIWKFYIDDIISQNGHQGVLERPRRQHQQEKDGKSGMSRVKSIRSEEGDQIGMQLQYSSQKKKNWNKPQSKTHASDEQPSPCPRIWQDALYQKKPETIRAPKMRNSAQCSLVNTHKMQPVYQPSRPKNQIPKKSQVSRAKIQPSQQSLRGEKRRAFDIHRGFDQRRKNTTHKNQNATKVPPRGTRTAFWLTDTPVRNTARSVFLGRAACRTLQPRLFARQRDKKNKSLRS